MYVFCTDILIAFLQGRLPRGVEVFRDADPRLVKIPSVAKAELLLAAAASSDPERSRKAADALLANFEVVPFDDRCASVYARIRAELDAAESRSDASGAELDASDLMTAATALAYDAFLVTNDPAGFRRIPDLRSIGFLTLENERHSANTRTLFRKLASDEPTRALARRS